MDDRVKMVQELINQTFEAALMNVELSLAKVRHDTDTAKRYKEALDERNRGICDLAERIVSRMIPEDDGK